MSHPVDRRGLLRAAGAGAAALGLGSALTSCGSDKESGTVTLTWWDYFTLDNFQPAFTRLIKDIEAEVPGVRIERRTFPFADLERQITLGAVSGDLPDIAIVDNVSMNSLAYSGLLADLTERVEAWGQADQYYKGPWDGCQVDGKSLGIPNNSNCLALYYNTRMLDSAGVEPPTTWDQLADTAQRLTSGERFGLAMSAIRTEEGVFQFLPFLWQAAWRPGHLRDVRSDRARLPRRPRRQGLAVRAVRGLDPAGRQHPVRQRAGRAADQRPVAAADHQEDGPGVRRGRAAPRQGSGDLSGR